MTTIHQDKGSGIISDGALKFVIGVLAVLLFVFTAIRRDLPELRADSALSKDKVSDLDKRVSIVEDKINDIRDDQRQMKGMLIGALGRNER